MRVRIERLRERGAERQRERSEGAWRRGTSRLAVKGGADQRMGSLRIQMRQTSRAERAMRTKQSVTRTPHMPTKRARTFFCCPASARERAVWMT